MNYIPRIAVAAAAAAAALLAGCGATSQPTPDPEPTETVASQTQTDAEYAKEHAAAAKPFVKSIRANWPKQSKPYSDAELVTAADDLCLVDPGDYWDLKAWNEARQESLTDDGIKNQTLRMALMGETARNGGYCEVVS